MPWSYETCASVVGCIMYGAGWAWHFGFSLVENIELGQIVI